MQQRPIIEHLGNISYGVPKVFKVRGHQTFPVGHMSRGCCSQVRCLSSGGRYRGAGGCNASLGGVTRKQCLGAGHTYLGPGCETHRTGSRESRLLHLLLKSQVALEEVVLGALKGWRAWSLWQVMAVSAPNYPRLCVQSHNGSEARS